MRNGGSVDASEGGSADLDKPVDTMKRDMANMFKKVSNTIRRDVMSQSYAVSETEKSLQDVILLILSLSDFGFRWSLS